MNKQESHKDTLEFLKTFDDRDIFDYNADYYDEDFFLNFSKNSVSNSRVLTKITSKFQSDASETDMMELVIFIEFFFLFLSKFHTHFGSIIFLPFIVVFYFAPSKIRLHDA